ncbi:DNA alkylation repair protein [Culicoidibacter larvae]|uniref:DNA alkylation repair protein n=1 Tax=Culicoidibacter larvae TaxID=2579976 RepID=A0A5R8Q7S4_9FIRM|nr:DNA alkylation repair protein [Culicoidibacter larvae]TLG71536.1 DNA alkylation repair protein [Culicoidibacter larvae]
MVEDIKSSFYAASNQAQATAMEDYLRNLFPFLGIAAPLRKQLQKPFITAAKQLDIEALKQVITELYVLPEREFQYAAIDIAVANTKRFSYNDIVWLYQFIDDKPWWESVDSLRKVFEVWCLNNYELFPQVMSDLSTSASFWRRRVAITMQLKYKDKLDTEWLTQVILADRLTEEFFIQKAIGWSLREYSKVNSPWVIDFVASNQLSPLASREAFKIINKRSKIND